MYRTRYEYIFHNYFAMNKKFIPQIVFDERSLNHINIIRMNGFKVHHCTRYSHLIVGETVEYFFPPTAPCV